MFILIRTTHWFPKKFEFQSLKTMQKQTFCKIEKAYADCMGYAKNEGQLSHDFSQD